MRRTAPPLRRRPGGPSEWRLWPGAVPGTPAEPVAEIELPPTTPAPHGDPGIFTQVRNPSLFVYPSANPNGAAWVMAPGGGMIRVSIGAGTGDIARWFNDAGATVFVLKYRVPNGNWTSGADASLQDAQRAVRMIRTYAPYFQLDPARIGMIGFSGGGYPTAALATRYDADVYEPIDAVDEESAAPNLIALMYPVIALDQPYTLATARAALIGADASPAIGARYSPDRYVSPATPPTFLAHALDDRSVAVGNTLAMHAALVRAGVPVQMHLFESGGHGINLGPLGAPRTWSGLFRAWAAQRNFLRA
jgi:acetyl esterase/lipase